MSLVNLWSSILGPWGRPLRHLVPLGKPLSLFYPQFSALLAFLGFMFQVFLDFSGFLAARCAQKHGKSLKIHRRFYNFDIFAFSSCSCSQRQLSSIFQFKKIPRLPRLPLWGPSWPIMAGVVCLLGQIFGPCNPSDTFLGASWNQFQHPMTIKTLF